MFKQVCEKTVQNPVIQLYQLGSEYEQFLPNIIDQNILINDEKRALFLIKYIFDELNILNNYYPNFDLWLTQKVLNGMYDGTRQLLIKWSSQKIAAISIIKNNTLEKKICCLRVMSDYINSGVGVRIFVDSMKKLEEEKPLLSVNENNLPQFKRIFNYFGYKQYSIYPSLYKTGISEISFNGLLK